MKNLAMHLGPQMIPATAAATVFLALFMHGLAFASDDNPITRNFKCRKNGCCDQHEWCRFWATMGECKKNVNWMEANCQLACGSCKRASLRRLPPSNAPAHGSNGAPSRTLPPPSSPHTTTNAQLSRTRPPPPLFVTTIPAPPPPFPPLPTSPSTTITLTTITAQAAVPISALDRCRQIRSDPSVAAEVMLREGLVSATEDNSGRTPLSQEQVVRSNIANACVPRLDEAECERSLCYNLLFRTMDSSCNNFRNPLRGAAFRPYSRLLPPEYDNGISEPVSSIRIFRPNPREVSRTVLSSIKHVPTSEFNTFLMQFGQFISHDIAKTTLVPSAKCNVCQNIPGRCMAVMVQPQDHNQKFKSDVCLRVSRSSEICGSGRQLPRQQLNENTGYIDASPIYGSSVGDLHKFREGNTPLLKLERFNGMRLLPFDSSKCQNPSDCSATFIAGDSRVNLFLGLSSFHMMLTREHNRLAMRLQRLNPRWNSDRLFQEARKIVGAQVQAIVYREYLPKVLGSAFAATVGPYRGYDPDVDSTVANEFTSAAYRFGHGMIQEFYLRLDENNQSIASGGFQLVDGLLHSDKLIFQGGADPIVRGMLSTPLKRPQRLTRSVTEEMFEAEITVFTRCKRHCLSQKLKGLPSYIRFRQLCGLSSPSDFEQLSREIMSSEARANLQRIYGSTENIDFFVGGLLEDPVLRGLVGPTIACVIGPQFARTRDGDRFYFENPGIFTRAQLHEIHRSSLARLICDNADNIQRVPREAFRLEPIVNCNEIPQMDLMKWKE